ncbi:ATP-binding protein [Candidatus Poribacteria bacterium]|nr:ATP-binding protein [Candidatus Poribacteria bacterium]
MNTSRLYEIDQLLEELKNAKKDQLEEKRDDFLENVCHAAGLSSGAPPHDALFNQRNNPQERKFIALCLLRLLCHNQDIIWNPMEFRLKTFTLLDEQIGEIYKDLGIKPEDDNHEKLAKLCETERLVLADFDQITGSIVSLNTALKIRQRFMQTLRYPRNRLFLEQFVDASLISNERLSEIFETVEEYNESSMMNRLDSYQNIMAVFESFLRDAEKTASIFTKQCLVVPVKKICAYIQEDFNHNDAIQPTTVSIMPLDRKYPFHLTGRKLELKFRVENEGPGYAFDVEIHSEDADQGLKLCYPMVNLGTLAHHQSSEIVFETVVENEIKGSPVVSGQVYWRNFDKSRKSEGFIFELTPQRTDLDWDNLKSITPYSLEAIKRAEDLVGRTELIQQLCAKLSSDEIESSIIHGQKRVGKTSIAKVIQANFDQKPNYTVIFVSIGDLNKTTPEKFVTSLGEEIVTEVSYHPDFAGMEKPTFEGALSPLSRYFKNVKRLSPEHRFIIILDEFDEIPLEIVRYGSGVGDTFFHNIRSISSEGRVGFVLVGGENMQIIKQSTDRLNKMDIFRVDYFDKQKYWRDFRELVKRPVEDTIEFSDEAINRLYEMTEGNPFYTKFICKGVYTRACEDRNAYISEDNVEEAIRESIEALDVNQVNHFWKDGIFEDEPARRDQIETQRRKFLIAFAQIKRNKTFVNRQALRESEILKNDVAVDEIIESYMNRGVLLEEEDHYRWKPRFFDRWLVERGGSLMTSGFLDENAITALTRKEQEAYIQDKEIVELCRSWGLYRGSEITPSHVRSWLNQFNDNTERRLMFRLLQHFRFYNEPRIREKIVDIHRKVQSELAQMDASRSGDRRRRRQDILLSSFGQPSKSGSSYTRIYAIENKIAVDNVAWLQSIPEALEKNERIKAIVFIDDIIASGDSAVEFLDNLNSTCGELIAETQTKVFISAICGFRIGVEKLEAAIEKIPFDAEVIVSDILTEVDQCFSEESEIFPSAVDRGKAKQIALAYGKKIQSKQPLGYQDSQLLVVFHDNCPNNTLPILWSRATGKITWTPLFERN